MKMQLTMKLFVTLLFTLGTCAALTGTAKAADAKESFEKQCASCHGKDGKGQTRQGRQAGVKDYTDAKVQEEMKDDKALETVKAGIKEGAKERMKPYKDKLTDEEIKALIAYMRTFKPAK